MHTAKLVPDTAADDDGDASILNGTQGAIYGGGNGSSSSVLEGEVVVVNDKEEEETVEASNMVEPVEITNNIVFRKLLVSSNICSQMPILKIQFLLKGLV
nr:hypothetical protein CFP56_76352 [Quercus suber]